MMSAHIARRRLGVLVAVLAMIGSALVLHAPIARADPPAGFVIPGPNAQLAVANGLVFDWDYDLFDNTVHVFDLTGTEVGAITNEPDVQSLTASPDGKRIYAGLGSAKALSVIDTGTLTETARYDASAIGAPVQVAEAGNRLFVGGMQNPVQQPLFEIGVVDLGAPSGSSIPELVETGNSGGLAAAESSPGVDEVYATGCSLLSANCRLFHYRYTGGSTLPEQQRVDLFTTRDLALAPDLSAVYAYDHDARVMSMYRPDDLSVLGTVAVGDRPVWFSIANQHLIDAAYDQSLDRYDDLQVRDSAGALTFEYQTAGRGLEPLIESGSTDLFVADWDTDNVLRLERLPGALGQPSVPPKPQNLRAKTGPAGTVGLSWTALPSYLVDAPTGYRLYRSDTAGELGSQIATLAGAARDYTDSGRSTGIGYYYTLIGSNSTGDGPASDQVSAVADASPPVPTQASAPAFQLSKAIAVGYSASDAGSGVAYYDVRYRAAAWNGVFGGYGYPAGWQHTTKLSQTLLGAPGHEYCTSVRAWDAAGNASGWTADRCTTLPLDDRSLTAATAGWSRPGSALSYGGTLTRTNVLGAQLVLKAAQLNRLALVVAECASCGNVALYLNNVYWRTVSTYAPSTRYSVIVVQPPFSQRTATITLRNASAGRNLIVDGLGIGRS